MEHHWCDIPLRVWASAFFTASPAALPLQRTSTLALGKGGY